MFLFIGFIVFFVLYIYIYLRMESPILTNMSFHIHWPNSGSMTLCPGVEKDWAIRSGSGAKAPGALS